MFLLVSGASLAPALEAALMLREDHGLDIDVDVWSVTRYASVLRAARAAGASSDATRRAAQMAHNQSPIPAVTDGSRSMPKTRPFEPLA